MQLRFVFLYYFLQVSDFGYSIRHLRLTCVHSVSEGLYLRSYIRILVQLPFHLLVVLRNIIVQTTFDFFNVFV